MLEQLRAKSTAATAATAAALEKAGGSLRDVAQSSSVQALQSKARSAAESLNLKNLPTVVRSASASSVSTADTDDSEGKSPAPTSKNQEEEGLLDEFGQECKLTKRQRLYGAAGCYAFGALCSFLATLMMWGGPKHLKQFAFFYTVGNLCSIGSSLFLVGPKHQLKVMCLPVRRVACCVWMGAMLLTLIIAFAFPKAGILVLFLVAIQYAAMLWYGASFIPYGRAMLKKCCQKAAGQVANV